MPSTICMHGGAVVASPLREELAVSVAQDLLDAYGVGVRLIRALAGRTRPADELHAMVLATVDQSL